ncbi:hypothetical protein EON63_14035 [archaeon]|nr:MAG: hypothetical protein EON63_14035 [archaeon]
MGDLVFWSVSILHCRFFWGRRERELVRYSCVFHLLAEGVLCFFKYQLFHIHTSIMTLHTHTHTQQYEQHPC